MKFTLLRCLLVPTAILLCLSTANAQERVRLEDVNSRLVRVERVLDQSLLELLQQVEALKREIRVLRGELENQTYELGNVKKRNRDLYLDTDQRLTDIEKRTERQLNLLDDGTLGDDTTGSIDGLDVDGQQPVFVETDTDAEITGSEAADVEVEPENAAALEGNNPEIASSKDLAVEKAAYSKAYDSLASGNGDEAVAGFEAFLREYPDGAYADNAWYWQGEARYSQREFEEAIKLFESVVSLFPESQKVPDARLKIAYALYEQQRYTESRAELAAVVKDYPGRAAGTLASKRLAEMDAKGQ